VAPGVLANDTPQEQSLTAILDLGPAHGSVTLNPGGSFTYQPDPDYNGPDSFTYRTMTGALSSDDVTVSLTVRPVNDAPSFIVGGDRFVTDESGARHIGHWAYNVSAGPADEAGQKLTFFCTADKPDLLAVQPEVQVAFGTYGSLTYTLKPNHVGVVTVTIRLMDDGGTSDGGVDTGAPQTFKINIAKAHPGHNAVLALDVNGDGGISPNDALLIINQINAFGSGPVDPVAGVAAPYLDVSMDGYISPMDALAVINYLNSSRQGAATFVGTDTATQGSWQSLYGADGYALNSGPASLPFYARISLSGEYDVTWAASTDDPRALQNPGSTDRLAAAWTGHNSSSIPLNGFTLDLNLIDGKTHRVAIYILDWDAGDRTQQMDVLDANSGQVLDTQFSMPFHDGIYYVWNLSGHVQIRFTNLANGLNAVASGIFFG